MSKLRKRWPTQYTALTVIFLAGAVFYAQFSVREYENFYPDLTNFQFDLIISGASALLALIFAWIDYRKKPC